MKQCSKCEAIRPLKQFKKKNGNQCLGCIRRYHREYKKLDKARENNRKYTSSARMRQWYRDYHLRRNYGISSDQYDQLFDKQEGKCLICATHQREFKQKLAVDHCHKTGKVRGLLCKDCNHGLGVFKDCVKRLKNAVTYLKKLGG